MTFFFDRYIRPFLSTFTEVRVLEIGASEGSHSERLLSLPGTFLTIIDPCIDMPLDEVYASNDRVRVIKDISLNALPNVSGQFDAILIDGDHNWYTVHSELTLIAKNGLLASGGAIFFHDVGWPYGRRDMYYRPELIPAEFRQPHAQRGLVKGRSELSDSSSFNSHLHNATREGGSKNGVLTAIRDFVAASSEPFKLFTLFEEAGLGVMVRAKDCKVMAAVFEPIRYRQMELRKAAVRTRFPFLYALLRKLLKR